MTDAVLQTDGICKSFGALEASRDITLELRAGEIHALMDKITVFYRASQALFGVTLESAEGEVLALMECDGMGKSATVKAICRMLPLRSGTISFDGTDLARIPSHAGARMGLGLVLEGRQDICAAIATLRAQTGLALLVVDKSLHGSGTDALPRRSGAARLIPHAKGAFHAVATA